MFVGCRKTINTVDWRYAYYTTSVNDKMVLSNQLQVKSGLDVYEINVKNLTKGYYNILFKSSAAINVKKLIKM